MTSKVTTHHDEGGRVCTLCRVYLPWSHFGRQKGGFNGKYPYCARCKNERYKKRGKMDWCACCERHVAMDRDGMCAECCGIARFVDQVLGVRSAGVWGSAQ